MSGEPTVFKGVKKTQLTEIIEKYLGPAGRMIAWSKTAYRDEYPKNKVYFNACIFDELLAQVWWGDIDLTQENHKLEKIAEVSEQPFYVTLGYYRADFEKITQKQLDDDDRIIKFNEMKRRKK